MNKESKDRINKRKIAFVYLMHRMFEGNPAMMIKILRVPGLTVGDLQDWDMDYKEAVYKTIQEEDTKGVKLKDPEDVPSIKGIKEKLLRRVDQIINTTEDPGRLATTYKILSEFEVADDKKEKSVIDAINESVKPLTPKKKEKITMLEKMRQENKLSATPTSGKKRGRPKKEEASIIPEELTNSESSENEEQEEPQEE